ncbi:MAG: hypothetical protein IT329_21575 [Caldilineaceae bacterium]|nr:hypothetical protein [Caldilineaceae bacterium]
MDRLIRRVVLAGVIAALVMGPAGGPLLAAPRARAEQQERSFDPALAESVARGVAATAGLAAYGAPSAAAPGLSTLPALRRPTPVPQEELTPTPEAEATPTPGGTPEPGSPDLVEYSSGGITLQAPAEWEVSEGDFGSLFDMSVPNGEFVATLQDAGGDFPGMILVYFFANMPEMLVGEYMEGAGLTSIEIGRTVQDVPMAGIHFDATIEGVEGSGAFYAISPGETAYMFFAFAPAEEWVAVAPGVAQVAESITFDEELLTLATAGSGGLVFGDNAGILETTIPEGWHVTGTNDETLPLLIADPEYTLALMLGTESEMEPELGAMMDELLNQPGGEVDPAVVDEAFAGLVERMMQDGDFTVDETLNAYFPREGAITLRLGGEGDFSGLITPAMVYFDLRSDGAVMQIIFGDLQDMLAQEEELLKILTATDVLD